METAWGITHVDTVISLVSTVLKLASLFNSHISYSPPAYAWVYYYAVPSVHVLGIKTDIGTG
jgi:hypothetical protein